MERSVSLLRGPSRALAVLGLAALCVACETAATQPSTAPATPSPTPAGGEQRIEVPGFGEVVAVLPPGWEVDGAVMSTTTEDEGTPTTVSVWTVGQVYADPCHWDGSEREVGRSAKALAKALADQPGRGTAEAKKVTVGDRSAEWVTLEVPEDADLAACDDGELRSWPAADEQQARAHATAGEVDEIYVFQFRKLRVVVDASYFDDISSAELGQLRRIVSSMEFVPVSH
jgi:hypothetical protein